MKTRITFIISSLILIVSSVWLFIELSTNYFRHNFSSLDKKAASIAAHIRSDNFIPTVRIFTHFGDNFVYLFFSVVAAFWFRNKQGFRFIRRIPFVIAFSYLLSHTLKDLIARPRPEGMRIIPVSTASFPSGHALSAAVFYLLVIYIFFKFNFDKKYTILVFSLSMIVLIGMSRIYLGVHYLSDVLGGYSAGTCLASFCVLINELVEDHETKNSISR